jgi:hypothetical protein
MEVVNNDIDEALLDQLGAHFKFKDMATRLSLAIMERMQDKRSADLLSYQYYFSQNEQPMQVSVQTKK